LSPFCGSDLQGKEVIEFYINELLSEGVTFIPPWTEPDGGQTGVDAGATGSAQAMTRGTSDAETSAGATAAATTTTLVSPCGQARPRLLSSGSRTSMDLGASAGNIAAAEMDGRSACMHAFLRSLPVLYCLVQEHSKIS